jgi:hypothetical protein
MLMTIMHPLMNSISSKLFKMVSQSKVKNVDSGGGMIEPMGLATMDIRQQLEPIMSSG